MDHDWHYFVSTERFLCVLQSESSAGHCTHPPADRRGKPPSLRWRRHHANHHTMWRHHEGNRHKTLGWWRHPNWGLSGSEQRWHRMWRHACRLFVDLSCSCGRIGENDRLSGDSFVCPETVHWITEGYSFLFCLFAYHLVCLSFFLFSFTLSACLSFFFLWTLSICLSFSFFLFLSTLSFFFFHSFGLLSSFYLSFVPSCFSGLYWSNDQTCFVYVMKLFLLDHVVPQIVLTTHNFHMQW